jgi:hypothetical protein
VPPVCDRDASASAFVAEAGRHAVTVADSSARHSRWAASEELTRGTGQRGGERTTTRRMTVSCNHTHEWNDHGTAVQCPVVTVIRPPRPRLTRGTVTGLGRASGRAPGHDSRANQYVGTGDDLNRALRPGRRTASLSDPIHASPVARVPCVTESDDRTLDRLQCHWWCRYAYQPGERVDSVSGTDVGVDREPRKGCGRLGRKIRLEESCVSSSACSASWPSS